MNLQQHYDFVSQQAASMDYDVVATALIGSQNYGLQTPNSDIDSYSIVVPHKDKLWQTGNGEYRTTYDVKENDITVGIAKVKDIWSFAKELNKQCMTGLEILFSTEVIVNPKYQQAWEYLVGNRDAIATINLKYSYHANLGFYNNQRNNAMKPENYSDQYNGKAACHALRAAYFIFNFYENISASRNNFYNSMQLTPEQHDELMRTKLGQAPFDEVYAKLIGLDLQLQHFIPTLSADNETDANQLWEKFFQLCA